MLGKNKEDRWFILTGVWISAFVFLWVVICYTQQDAVTLATLWRSLPTLWHIKLLIPTMLTMILSLMPTADLDEIKSKTVGDGQHGSARSATDKEVRDTFCIVRPGQETKAGLLVGRKDKQWIIDTSDNSMFILAPPESGKSGSLIIPTIYYNIAVNLNTSGGGPSLLCTDMKGELLEVCGVALEEAGYRVAVLDLRNPFKSKFYNLMNSVNIYMDDYLSAKTEEQRLIGFGKAERYAKILAKSIVHNVDTTSSSDSGQYFNDTAQGLVTGIILLVSQYACQKEQRHIISVFNLIIELNGMSETAAVGNGAQKNKLQELLQYVDNDRIKSHVGAAMSADIRSSMNIFSSALGKLVDLIDAELEQMISRHSPEFNDVDFVSQPTAIFVVCPEENPTRFFFGSLFLRTFINDLIGQARELVGGRLPRQVICLWDEFGNFPAVQNVDTMFTAVRSAGIRIAIALQTLDQLPKIYGREKAGIIRKACQIVMLSRVSPFDHDAADEISKSLGNRTVQSGSVAMGKSAHQTVQMTGRALMTPDEILTMPIGSFICLKIGCRPMITKLEYYKSYLRQYPPYEVKTDNRAITIAKMTAEDIKHITKAVRLRKGMFD